MNFLFTTHRSPHPLAAFAAIVLGMATMAIAQAQQVYRIVGPDGKVSFSDQPPPSAAKPNVAGAAASATSPSGSDSSGARLPFELAKVARQYPVILYSNKDCAPCNSGRNLLTSRGIPFAEKTVENAESIEAFKQLSGQGSLPLLTIGSQQLKGYSDTIWTQYLNVAGYPEKSTLPSSFRRPAPVALAEAKVIEPTNASAKAKTSKGAAEVVAPETPVTPASSGIRF